VSISGTAGPATSSSASSASSAAPVSPCGASGATGTTTGCNREGVGAPGTATDPTEMRLKRLLRPLPHLERDPAQHALLVLISAGLALGAAIGISWAAGFTRVLHELHHVDPIWLPVAFGMEVAAYFGYVVAYREVARAEGGPRLGIGRAGAIVATGFGVFVIRGGFVVDRHALEAAGLRPRQARVRVLGLGALEYAILAPAAALAAVIILARSEERRVGKECRW